MSESGNENVDNVENEDGFLREMSSWSREIAEELAHRNDIGPLTEDHWKIIEFVKEYFEKHKRGPSILEISKRTNFDSKKICTLFPCGVARGAYRLAGLPRPSGCL
ncbi:MAG: TusE/DsrC/DsvC family sulfur relay protein [candidate division Zixibacteria bacterium]|nr:TusE/DsrC/DsvC family sulfur relay protein [candidate division Zixibacteria bacterium]